MDRVEGLLPESPTLLAIKDGKSEISLVGEGSFTQARVIDGINWLGSSYQYEITLPHPIKSGEKWTTYLTVWNPVVRHEWNLPPNTQIYITTGQGEMIFTEDQKKKSLVLDEINRQLNPPTQKVKE